MSALLQGFWWQWYWPLYIPYRRSWHTHGMHVPSPARDFKDKRIFLIKVDGPASARISTASIKQVLPTNLVDRLKTNYREE
jgi:hypothetical protein